MKVREPDMERVPTPAPAFILAAVGADAPNRAEKSLFFDGIFAHLTDFSALTANQSNIHTIFPAI